MNENNSKRHSRIQFTVRRLFALILLAAIGVVIWQRYIYVHPAHEHPLYEKAPFWRSGRAHVGPNHITISSISRSDRDGSLLIHDRKGNQLNTSVRNAKVLKSSADWLDTAQLELTIEPGNIEIYELRIFDHISRSDPADVDRFGYRIVDSNTIHVYGLGAKLPDKLDVWIRVLSFDQSDKPVDLAPQVGATCELGGGKLTIAQLVDGDANYRGNEGLVAYHQVPDDCTMLLEYDGPSWGKGARYQLITVCKDGRRIVRDGFLWNGDFYNGSTVVKRFLAGISEIDHFEIRPFREHKKFFYEGVRLPQTSQAKFAAPPKGTFIIDGKEQVGEIKELAPLKVRVSSHRGDYLEESGGREVIRRAQAARNTNEQSTVVYFLDGVKRGWDLDAFKPDGSPLKDSLQMTSHGRRPIRAGFMTSGRPIEELGKVEVQFD